MGKIKNPLPISCFLLTCLSVVIVPVSAHTCLDTGFFVPESPYGINHRLILSSLASTVTSQGGYYAASIGQEPSKCYALGMCIPAAKPEDCSDCIQTASQGLLQSCPNQTEAFSWFSDNKTLCLVRYSNRTFVRLLNLEPRVVMNDTGVTIELNSTEFDGVWEGLMNRMIDGELSLSRIKNYAADVTSLTNSRDIYALMLCTSDLSQEDCRTCLQESVDRNSNQIGRTVAIAVPCVFIISVLVALGFAFCRRRKLYQAAELESEDYVTSTSSLKFDFKTIEAATNKFSQRNKLK
ncbi:PREDICTED: cysteine-rich receptor-like protein kinase 11 isoform X1 [Tarenaya hassleriana]|uniref:cysteine-rich receptor-like protein kinase 11 isoform X1 n=1 Tax=Tarenaya hassleriana TaxID=28532 RepID=UPI00053C2745|nr:PREDICTED: cysteine-rich receptor-like protein kinase 11 isoform X1 [Tarenaya hassleriana]XP_010519686.1 PREDICTED: cysteine-rich receptor-like protein kinase 11 isoform X1 [Tarenaya hassleriana]XP_010519687.1 PREDICTED: cysteine-rich receptor-like protein kinase 11 isoform X1 [Tarenaya hassleriana]